MMSLVEQISKIIVDHRHHQHLESFRMDAIRLLQIQMQQDEPSRQQHRHLVAKQQMIITQTPKMTKKMN